MRRRTELVGVREVAELLGVSKQRVVQLRNAGQLPDPIAVLAAGPVWSHWDIVAYRLHRNRKPGPPAIGERR